ncbi:MAG: barstar family protein [Sideroxydans sp.]
MDDLCYLLQNPQGAGVYQLNCTLDALHESVARAGFALFEANIAVARSKGELLAELARAIAAPDWFGHNWDALSDALGDLSWRPAPGYVLLLRGEQPDEPVLADILAATVEYWRGQGKPFWVFYA